ncbi:DUF4390 domain-containing protein [Hydrogenophaga soli]
MLAALVVWAGLLGAAHAAAELQEVSVQRTSEGLSLSAAILVDLPPTVEDALLKSVPLYFVMQTEVLRERWYWSDKKLASRARTYRLAYQPLTRQWRVSVASGGGPGGSLQYALHQNHATLATALAAISRVAGWEVAETAQVEGEKGLLLDFRFWLDPALLPRPFQLGVNTRNDWGVDLRRRLEVPDQLSPAAPTADEGSDPSSTRSP